MNKRLLSIIVSIAVVATIICPFNFAFAESDAYETIKMLVKAESNHDWDLYSSLWVDPEKSEHMDFFQNKEYEKSERGAFTIVSARLVECAPISFSVLEEFMQISQFGNSNTKSSAFIVGIDYIVKQESKYYYNGVNYRLVILEQNDYQWQVSELQDAPLECLPNISSLGLNSANIAIATNIISQRQKGVVVNAKGDVLSSDLLSNTNTVEAITTLQHPSVINVWRAAYGVWEVWYFNEYCRHVLPCEWVASWPYESLYAGAVAVSQFGWFHTYHPKHPDVGCDVCDSGSSCQVFNPGSSNSRTDYAVSMREGDYMLSSSGYFFESQYSAGTYNSAYYHSGKMRQNGTHYWADQGQNWMYMCHYYYDNSPKSTGLIQIIY
jgi:hypothetical protein